MGGHIQSVQELMVFYRGSVSPLMMVEWNLWTRGYINGQADYNCTLCTKSCETSVIFEYTILTAERQYFGLFLKNSVQDIQIRNFYWTTFRTRIGPEGTMIAV